MMKSSQRTTQNCTNMYTTSTPLTTSSSTISFNVLQERRQSPSSLSPSSDSLPSAATSSESDLRTAGRRNPTDCRYPKEMYKESLRRGKSERNRKRHRSGEQYHYWKPFAINKMISPITFILFCLLIVFIQRIAPIE